MYATKYINTTKGQLVWQPKQGYASIKCTNLSLDLINNLIIIANDFKRKNGRYLTIDLTNIPNLEQIKSSELLSFVLPSLSISGLKYCAIIHYNSTGLKALIDEFLPKELSTLLLEVETFDNVDNARVWIESL
ncbi:MAG: hypothetical protein LAT68_02270 [Cyclobacteriaceae bacterium]|nr:hypothetical protein [Cyclobacteriaceae bacterium]MCH8515129.1 hypothetical protein [Cyclobacteriaceae bacterium]